MLFCYKLTMHNFERNFTSYSTLDSVPDVYMFCCTVYYTWTSKKPTLNDWGGVAWIGSVMASLVSEAPLFFSQMWITFSFSRKISTKFQRTLHSRSKHGDRPCEGKDTAQHFRGKAWPLSWVAWPPSELAITQRLVVLTLLSSPLVKLASASNKYNALWVVS